MKNSLGIQYLFLAVIGIGIPFFVVFRNIFPHFTYSLNQSLEFGLGLASKNLARQDYMIAALGAQYPFDSTKINLVFGKEATKTTDKISLQLAKDYMVNTYPIGTTITDENTLKKYLFDENPSGIANGSLYSYGESVFLVSRGRYYPVIAPVVFESLGYQWDQVMPLEAAAYSQLKAGEKINYMSVHPDGTLLKTQAGEFFLVWEGRRLPISDGQLIEKVWKTYYWVDIQDKEIDYFATCQSKLRENGQSSCKMNYAMAAKQAISAPGNVYIIKLDPEVLPFLQSAKSIFETSVNWQKEYLKFSLGQIKNKLYMRYAGYFL